MDTIKNNEFNSYTIELSKKLYQYRIETLPGVLYDYVLFPNGKSNFLYISNQCFDLLELTSQQLMSEINFFLNLIHQDDIERFHQTNVIANKNNKEFNIEIRIITSSGKFKWLQLNSRPISSSGIPKIWCGFMLDITQRKSVEEDLQKVKLELEDKIQIRTKQLEKINKFLSLEIEERKSTEKKLIKVRNDLRAMASKMVLSEEQTKQNFAIILHNSIVQTLVVIKLRMQLTIQKFSEEVKNEFNGIDQMISTGLLQARQLMTDMSSAVFYELGLISAIEEFIEKISSEYKIYIQFKIYKKNEILTLKHEFQVFLFQAIKELITNVVKHAKSNSIIIKIDSNSQEIQLVVEDNGQGFDGKIHFKKESNQGFGLFSLRERIRSLGGKLLINSKKNQGTRIEIFFPKFL